MTTNKIIYVMPEMVSNVIYKKKGNKMYKLVWRNEIIESDIATKKEARFLQKEYILAYGGDVKIVKQYKLRSGK